MKETTKGKKKTSSNKNKQPTNNISMEDILAQLSVLQAWQQQEESSKYQLQLDLESLRQEVDRQQRELNAKEAQIRQLERNQAHFQEAHKVELRGLVRNINNSSSSNNPYTGGEVGLDDDHPCADLERLLTQLCCIPEEYSDTMGSPRYPNSTLYGHRSRAPPKKKIKILHVINALVFCILGVHFWYFGHIGLQDPHHPVYDLPRLSGYANNNQNQPSLPEIVIKPWESTPPKPIPLLSSSSSFVKQRHVCIQKVRDRQDKIFGELLGPNAVPLLVDPAYHANVGDHMLSLAEITYLKNTLHTMPQQCNYLQASGFYPSCKSILQEEDDDEDMEDEQEGRITKVALWHAGGNWGDLWRSAMDVRIPSFQTILKHNYRLVGMPQSLYYSNDDLRQKDIVKIKEKIAIGLGLAKEEEDEEEIRQQQFDRFGGMMDMDDPEDPFSDPQFYDHHNNNYYNPKPVNTSKLDTPEGQALAQSRVIFTWREKESLEAAQRMYPFVRNILAPDIAFQLGPYAPIRSMDRKSQMVDVLIFLRDDIESKVSSERNRDYIRTILPRSGITFTIVDWPDRLKMFDTKDHFFTDTSIELLSLGKVVVCDRLHAAILSYLAGIPFVYIDQVSGKVTKTLTGAFDGMDDCLDGTKSLWSKATSLSEALAMAVKMMDQHRSEIITGETSGVLGGLRNFWSQR